MELILRGGSRDGKRIQIKGTPADKIQQVKKMSFEAPSFPCEHEGRIELETYYLHTIHVDSMKYYFYSIHETADRAIEQLIYGGL